MNAEIDQTECLFLDAWLAGGCALCGGSEREGRSYSHDRCYSKLVHTEKSDMVRACDLFASQRAAK